MDNIYICESLKNLNEDIPVCGIISEMLGLSSGDLIKNGEKFWKLSQKIYDSKSGDLYLICSLYNPDEITIKSDEWTTYLKNANWNTISSPYSGGWSATTDAVSSTDKSTTTTTYYDYNSLSGIDSSSASISTSSDISTITIA